MPRGRIQRRRPLCAGLLLGLVLPTTGCATDWGVRRGPTLAEVGEGVLAIGAAVGAGFGLSALQDAGGGLASSSASRGSLEYPWERRGR